MRRTFKLRQMATGNVIAIRTMENISKKIPRQFCPRFDCSRRTASDDGPTIITIVLINCCSIIVLFAIQSHAILCLSSMMHLQ